MIFKLKKFLRYILRKVLFKDDCIICNVPLKMQENALCIKCLKNLKNVSSLKKYKNIYYLWMIDENFFKILQALRDRRIFVEDLREIVAEKIIFILKNEKISSLIYKNSEFFTYLFNKRILKNVSSYLDYKNDKKLIIEESLNKRIEDKNIYFSLFMNKKLIEM